MVLFSQVVAQVITKSYRYHRHLVGLEAEYQFSCSMDDYLLRLSISDWFSLLCSSSKQATELVPHRSADSRPSTAVHLPIPLMFPSREVARQNRTGR